MFQYLFGWNNIPEAPPCPSLFEVELRNCKLKHIQLGRNKVENLPVQPLIVKRHLAEILDAKERLKHVVVIKKDQVYVPRHPVLRQLINTVPRA